MVNLLPKKDKRIVEREYLFRLATIVFFALSIVVSIGIVLLLPSFFLVESKRLSLEQLAQSAGVSVLEENSAQVLLQETKMRLVVLDQSRETKPISNLVVSLLEERPREIRLTSITYKVQNKNSGSMTVSGVAQNRSALITFTKRLERNRYFTDINFPVSNLASNENILFSISTNTINQ